MIELVVKLKRAFAGAELGPGESRQAEVNDGGVQAVERVLEAEAVLRRQIATAAEQRIKKSLINSAVTLGVGIGKRGLGNLGWQAEVIEAASLSQEAVFDVAQALLAAGLRVEE